MMHPDPTPSVLAALLAMQRQSWEQGVASHALLDLGEEAAAEVVARDSVTRQTADGRLADMGDSGIVNSGSVGEVVLWAAERGDDSDLRDAYRRQLDWILTHCPRAADGTLFHIENTREAWVDTVYMAVPLLVLAGETDAANLQFARHREHLFDESAALYGWRWEERDGLIHGKHWGTGNGWVVAAIARALRISPGSLPGAEEHALAVIDACLAHRDGDGGFHDVIDDPATFPESNLAQMIAFTLYTGLADRWVPDRYEPVADSLLAHARSLVDGFGFVRGVCGAPRFDRQGTSVEAQSFFLLATAAARRWAAARG